MQKSTTLAHVIQQQGESRPAEQSHIRGRLFLVSASSGDTRYVWTNLEHAHSAALEPGLLHEHNCLSQRDALAFKKHCSIRGKYSDGGADLLQMQGKEASHAG